MRKLTKEEIAHYVWMCKVHEKQRTSTNDRLKYWKEYFEDSQKKRAETSFKMNRF